MIREAIEKIEDLVNHQHPVENVDGHSYYFDGSCYFEIRPDIDAPDCQSLNSLDALVQMIKREAVLHYEKVFVEVVNHSTVSVFTNVMENNRWGRWSLYDAHATDVPGWGAEETVPFERAAIALQTRFQDTADRDYTLQLLSQITTGAKVTYNDIGVATTVVSQKGISLQQNQTIKPVVTLKPYRTFQEVEQPDGRFLIRISERSISFIEADGGMWKLAARKTVKEYLEAQLADEIGRGDVVVML